MIKAKCIDSGNMRCLLSGKEYEVRDTNLERENILIIDESGFIGAYAKSRFEIVYSTPPERSDEG